MVRHSVIYDCEICGTKYKGNVGHAIKTGVSAYLSCHRCVLLWETSAMQLEDLRDLQAGVDPPRVRSDQGLARRWLS